MRVMANGFYNPLGVWAIAGPPPRTSPLPVS
jgi:hypothetical protein